ncbi:23410_t:CDS:2, partial [Gigaspora margarita]
TVPVTLTSGFKEPIHFDIFRLQRQSAVRCPQDLTLSSKLLVLFHNNPHIFQAIYRGTMYIREELVYVPDKRQDDRTQGETIGEPEIVSNLNDDGSIELGDTAYHELNAPKE